MLERIRPVVADMGVFSAFLTEPNQVVDKTTEITAMLNTFVRFLTCSSSVKRSQCTTLHTIGNLWLRFFVLAY